MLLHMRLEAIRGDQAGLEHINALLLQKGYNPDNQLIRQYRPRVFKRGELSRYIAKALRDGPKAGPEVVAYVGKAKGVSHEGLRMSVHVALSGGVKRGAWASEGGLWLLV